MVHLLLLQAFLFAGSTLALHSAHVLFGALGSLYFYCDLSFPSFSSEGLSAFAAVLRRMVGWANQFKAL